MARIFVTGSSDGLGRSAAKLLVEMGHQVVLHARNQARARDAAAVVAGAERVLIGDFASLAQVSRLADEANALGTFDAVIHNAALGYREKRRLRTEDGFSHVFAVNTLAPAPAHSAAISPFLVGQFALGSWTFTSGSERACYGRRRPAARQSR